MDVRNSARAPTVPIGNSCLTGSARSRDGCKGSEGVEGLEWASGLHSLAISQSLSKRARPLVIVSADRSEVWPPRLVGWSDCAGGRKQWLALTSPIRQAAPVCACETRALVGPKVRASSSTHACRPSVQIIWPRRPSARACGAFGWRCCVILNSLMQKVGNFSLVRDGRIDKGECARSARRTRSALSAFLSRGLSARAARAARCALLASRRAARAPRLSDANKSGAIVLAEQI